MKQVSPILSVIVPVYNEAAGIKRFNAELTALLRAELKSYEIIYVDDGSTDKSVQSIIASSRQDSRIKLIALSRNFGKEVATTAGIHAASGQAIVILDADGQHPIATIPDMLNAWRNGAKVVLGKRRTRRTSVFRRYRSRLFYAVFSRLTGIHLDPDATDFRLIDRQVQADFNRMTERNRITRGLIDWVGYERTYIEYDENPRMTGEASQSFRRLFKLAIDSIISLSTSPLYAVAYIGAVVLPASVLLGVGMVGNYLLGDPLGLDASGGAYVMVLILFLIGVLLVSQGIIGLYLSHIHAETQNRPLYVVDINKSKGL